MKRCFCFLLAVILAETFSLVSFAEEPIATENLILGGEKSSYSDYNEEYSKIPMGTEEICVDSLDYLSAQLEMPLETESVDGIAWGDGTATITYRVYLEEATRYAIYLKSTPLANMMSCELSVSINGQIPFNDASTLQLGIPWEYSSEFKSDSRGNHIMPEANAIRAASVTPLRDYEGLFDDPYAFVFQEGENTITLTFQTGNLSLHSIVLKNEKEPLSYDEYRKVNSSKEDYAAEAVIRLDAEKPTAISSSSIMPNYERDSAATQPSDPDRLLLNSIGGDNWTGPGQWLQYTVDVEKSGWYRLYLRARQNVASGMTVKRSVRIDGELPFREAEELEVPFSVQWNVYTPGGEDPYLFYLDEGKHTITLTVVSGEYGSVTNVILETVYALNDLYRDIISITGTSPNAYQDYNLSQKLPDMEQRLAEAENMLSEQLSVMERLGKKGSQTAALEDLVTQLGEFLDKPDRIPRSVEFFRSNISAVSSWVLNLCNQPLELDWIELTGSEMPAPESGDNFFLSLWFTIRTIFSSFFHDYDMIGDVSKGEKSITVWVSAANGVAGRDQAQAIKQIADERFTQNYGIHVNVSTVKAGIIESMMAGVGPDVALFMGYTDPVNLASRGAICNLSAFEGFEEVEDRFYESAITPFRYREGIYALPLTQKFPMLFYRTDIFEELEISVPKTWQEFQNVIPVIQGENMNVGMPDIFATLLYQKGGNYYTEDLSETLFDSVEAAEAFSEWCSYYSEYGLPISYDFYNRFRTGEMPLAIADYTVYLQLYAAAPEIRGFWEMTSLPGTVKEDGTVDDTVVGYGSECAIILSSSKNQESGWEFLRWFTSDEIQAAYGNLIEARLGTIGRYVTANKNAFYDLPVSVSLRTEILNAWEKVVEVPQIPASYYVGRNLTNAYRRVVYYYENPRQTLHVYNSYINREIARKNAEIERFSKKGE